jgi:hypothetical protein
MVQLPPARERLEIQAVHICIPLDNKSEFRPSYEVTRTFETRVLGGGTTSPCIRMPSM